MTMSNNNYYFSKNFIRSLIISTIIILSTFLLSSFVGFNAPPEDAQQLASEIENLAATTTWTDIFLNNFLLTLVTFIPAFGIFFAVFVQFGTGYGFGALAQAYHVNNLQITLLTLLTPVGILEYSAYILALAESITLAYSIYKKELKKRLITHTWKTLTTVALLLLIGAVVEAAFIGRL
jgi:uncharacterized membrane protein SpoIIM required for sporulation